MFQKIRDFLFPEPDAYARRLEAHQRHIREVELPAYWAKVDRRLAREAAAADREAMLAARRKPKTEN